MSARKYPPSMYEEAAALRERGWSLERLARKFGCSQGVLSWNMLKLGADPPKLAQQVLPQTRRGPLECTRGGRVVRAFTPADDAMIRRLSVEGLGSTAIGRQLSPPRLANSVTGRLMTLARQDARREAAADARSIAA